MKEGRKERTKGGRRREGGRKEGREERRNEGWEKEKRKEEKTKKEKLNVGVVGGLTSTSHQNHFGRITHFVKEGPTDPPTLPTTNTTLSPMSTALRLVHCAT